MDSTTAFWRGLYCAAAAHERVMSSSLQVLKPKSTQGNISASAVKILAASKWETLAGFQVCH